MTPEQRAAAANWALRAAILGCGVTVWIVGLRVCPVIWLAFVAVALTATLRAWSWIGRPTPDGGWLDDRDGEQ